MTMLGRVVQQFVHFFAGPSARFHGQAEVTELHIGHSRTKIIERARPTRIGIVGAFTLAQLPQVCGEMFVTGHHQTDFP